MFSSLMKFLAGMSIYPSFHIVRRKPKSKLSSPPRSVDSETDRLMQAIIRTEFAGSTVFSIAHRLDTILDFDRIAFLDKGSLIEFDSPTKLLAKGPSSSAFARLYNGLPDQGFSKPC